ncbi:MAG TPA: hypothetical protein VJG90_01640 [Candidatus Nanoarchaeia archaeon]|nr:hypothetical protein [Candidatus Nanoarchaeia archaeon]
MPSKKPPKITVRYSGVYDRMLYLFVEGHPPADHDYFIRRKVEALEGVQRLKKEVLPKLNPYLEHMQQILGVSWESREVVCYALPYPHKPGPVGAFSDPLTIFLKRWEGERLFSFPSDRLLEHLIHEFCHIIQDPLLKTAYRKELGEHLRERNLQVLTHILAYAIFRKVVDQEQWHREVSIRAQNPLYKRALDLVQALGADKIIEEAKSYLVKKNRSKELK